MRGAGGNKGNRGGVNHFIMIPFEDESFIESYKKLCTFLKENIPEGFDERLLQKPTKLHFSVIILNLNEDPSLVEKVKTILRNLQPSLQGMANSKIMFEFEKFNYLGNEETKARVVYAEMLKNESMNLLNNVIDTIIRQLIIEGIINQNELQKYHITNSKGIFSILLHLTLLNITFLNKVIKQNKKSFDAQATLANIKQMGLASCPLKKINFCVMREDKATEKYELIESYDI